MSNFASDEIQAAKLVGAPGSVPGVRIGTIPVGRTYGTLPTNRSMGSTHLQNQPGTVPTNKVARNLSIGTVTAWSHAGSLNRGTVPSGRVPSLSSGYIGTLPAARIPTIPTQVGTITNVKMPRTLDQGSLFGHRVRTGTANSNASPSDAPPAGAVSLGSTYFFVRKISGAWGSLLLK